MKWQTVSFDWNQARAFLVTVEEGSLTAAARALGLTQPTLGRQVAALEDSLGVTLFDRVGRSLRLTPSGLELLDHVRSMGDAAGRVSLTASGQSQTVEGQVCITASDLFSVYHLPPVLDRLRDLAPGIEIEVLASNTISDLQRREADIAIRHVRPQQPDLIAKQLKDTTAHLYASPKYLDRHGRPECVDDLAKAVFVATGQPDRYLSAIQAFGLPLTKDNLKFVSESGIVAWELVRQGLGIAIMSKDIAALTPDVENILPDFGPVPIPMWLATHRELHTSRRIRLVFDLLADAFS
jgi:DNA-binding transcriptional LysR family regulator